MFKNFHKNKYNSGVTLVELMVVIAIFVIMSGVVLFNYGQFRSSTSIQNLADDIALSIRKAQSYAIGVRGANSVFNFGYGVHFTTDSNPSGPYTGSNKSFILFANISDNTEYNNSSGCGNPTAGNECLEVLNITSADKILEISAVHNGGNNKVDTLDIFFKRPNPEPTFCARNNGSSACIFGPVSSVKIKISNDSDLGVYKTITIWNNGQISVL